jgi:hypothetical protein
MTPGPAVPACAPAAEGQPVGAARVPRSANFDQWGVGCLPVRRIRWWIRSTYTPAHHNVAVHPLSTLCLRMYDTGVPFPIVRGDKASSVATSRLGSGRLTGQA